MKNILAIFAALTLGTAAVADKHSHDHHMSLDAIEWQDAPVPGVQLHLAWGDDAEGAAWLIKMDPGVAIPMHTHTSTYHGLSIQGTWVHIDADGTEVATQPGDYSRVEGGVAHADRCDSDIPCIGLIDFDGPRDVALVP